jgi:hypothetical protein
MRKHITLRHAGYFVAGCIVTGCLFGGAAQAITDTVFRYSTPKQGYLQLDPAGFTPLSNEGPGSYRIFYVYDAFIQTTVADACFGKSIELPHGATLTALSVWYQKGTHISLYRHHVAAGTATSTQIADRTFTSTQSDVRAGNVPITGPSAINNQSFSYAMIVCLPQTDNLFFGARVAYSYTTAGD